MRTGSAALVVAALGLICSASASAAITVPESNEPTSLAFKDGVASVKLVITNTGADSVNLVVKYVGAGAPVDGDGLPADGTAGPTGLRLVGPTPKEIAAHQAAEVTVEFLRPAGKPEVDGALVFSTGDSVATKAVKSSESPTGPKTGFAQDSDTLSVTAWAGPIARGCRWISHGSWCPGQHLSGTSLDVVADGVVDHVTRIGGGNGKLMNVWLHPGGDGKNTRLEATRIPAPSSYSGKVALTSTSSEKATVTVHVRDALIWPLIALGLGMLVSYWLTARRAPRRAADGLRVSLQEAVKAYLRTRKDDPVRPDRNYLDVVLNLDRERKPLSKKKQCVSSTKGGRRPSKEFPRLYADTFTMQNADQSAAVATGVAAMVARFDRWQQLNRAYRALAAVVRRLPADTAIYTDGSAKLDLAQGEPADDDDAKARINAMTSFAFLVHVYRDSNHAWENKSSSWQAKNPHLNPSMLYEQSKRTSDDELEALRLALLQLRRVLSHQVVPDLDPSLTVHENFLRAAMFTESLGIDGAAISIPVIRRSTPVYRDAAVIRRNVEQWDRVTFLVIAFLTALAYTLGFYAGKDWGSLTDYLAAFASGATVPTVVNWGLAPVTRTLTTAAKASS